MNRRPSVLRKLFCFTKLCNRPHLCLISIAVMVLIFTKLSIPKWNFVLQLVKSDRLSINNGELAAVTHHVQISYDCDFKMILSTCSCRADRRGLHQKVIAFSLYGNFSDPKLTAKYVDPLKITIERIKQVYPGWIIRIYSELGYKDQVSNQRLQELFEPYPEVDLCNTTRAFESLGLNIRQHFPMIWRFLPMLDKTVDYYMCRDTDSMVIDREVDAVREWLESPATFHVMRDHPWHCTPIVGGYWGVKVNQSRLSLAKATTALVSQRLHSSKHVYGLDQDLLQFYIWPLAQKDLMAHDSYCCKKFPQSTRAYPSKRQGFFIIGERYIYLNIRTLNDRRICPKECRPPHHQDWKYC